MSETNPHDEAIARMEQIRAKTQEQVDRQTEAINRLRDAQAQVQQRIADRQEVKRG